jgi:hypothetical protein
MSGSSICSFLKNCHTGFHIKEGATAHRMNVNNVRLFFLGDLDIL